MTFKQSASLFNIIPQGWGFFTRNPREEQTILYTIQDTSSVLFTKTISSIDNSFGASRKLRCYNVEVGTLISKINDSSWVEEKGGNLVFDTNLQTDTVKNNFYPCSIRGDFFFVKQERIPWAWGKSNIIMPYKYAKVHIK
jgi:antimicrobial peptide system SdpA family protein